ncbi:hypothetical protein HBH56_111150 [Parastagonospora nodorum]|uniref:Uncharacterized protein n=1 Tax=Phaeosphaeria nodorum (strain SN15 / ATCC MYA-4574 / FGSC 10173) TaxID=321614 RepID=A0A7U2I7T6_PHANO|nr:hypothetical protein HBH56_111150 [Parastagonospora nodorum]QRD03397.1 hypothetical protein JI435_419440 [Parastagonospora nodorum SN15]KAH3925512.1 hypothetical protein HBH54_179190 [Parastagonospora nodorum]KAH3950988.1 hypothetical protein HBH53_066840 [Parastagonospora nodorum]KAH4138686.1 hypothetical protein HBH45_106490 [Parastagonospora nodorum]
MDPMQTSLSNVQESRCGSASTIHCYIFVKTPRPSYWKRYRMACVTIMPGLLSMMYCKDLATPTSQADESKRYKNHTAGR